MQLRVGPSRPLVSAILLSLLALAAPVVRGQNAAPPAGGPPEARLPDFAAVVKDMEAIPGLLTLYRYRPGDPTKDHTRLLCQIPKALLKQDLLLATSISRGEMAGYMWGEALIRFEVSGRKVMINVPDPRFIQTPGQPVNDVVNRTYNESFLAAMPLLTLSPQGDPVVDLGPVLLSPDIAMAGSGSIGSGGMGWRRDLSEFTKIKVFPDNALIEVDLAQAGAGGGRRVGVCYSLRRLPEAAGYRPRLADERMGYFTTVRQDWGVKYSERETIVRYINRWDLKKKDPSLELSPPEKPIVFVIEKTVPLQWRKYVAEGISEWNKAYEKLGITGAIVVQQQTDDNEFANVDPEDSRYNFFRWIVTGRSFAMGPSRADPRTGQILDADIIFDDSMLRFWSESLEIKSPGPVASLMGPEYAEFLVANPAFLPAGQTLESAKETLQRLRGEMQESGPASSWRQAGYRQANSYASGMKHQLAMADLAAAATRPGKKVSERLIGEILKDIVTHEVGHTLGLRHNFKASSWLSLDEIKRRRDTTDEPTTASVMDYNALLFFPGDDPAKLRHLASPVLGPYDYWIIEYGYRIPGPGDGDEKTMLSKIAAQNTLPEYAFGTDEDTTGLNSPDPLTNRWDMSSDPIAWAKMRAELCDTLLKEVRQRAVKSSDPANWLLTVYENLMFEKIRNMVYVSRLVGGQLFHRNRPSDAQAKPALVLLEPARQREAIEAIAQTLFRDEFFFVDGEFFNLLTPSRWWDWSNTPSSRIDYPVHQSILSMQAYALLNITSPQVLQRIYDAELKANGNNRFTAAELISSVQQAVWGDLNLPDNASFTDAKPMLSSIRRNLQRQHLQYLLAIADSRNGSLVSPDLQNMVRYALREQSQQIGSMMSKAKSGGGWRVDFATRAHLSECKSQIDRVLDSPFIRS